MKHTLTPLLTLALVLVGVTNVQGQAGPPLGDDFIFFVDEISTMVPAHDLMVVDDPADATNKVIEFTYGSWTFNAFRWVPEVGVDISQNREDGDVFHARFWVHPENAGKGRVHFMFEDKTDGDSADDGSADLPFRLVWHIPESMRDGQWHTISVPLPPATYDELEAARAAGELDGLDSLWFYAGAYSVPGNFGVGISDRLGPNTEERPDLWEEFEWTNVQTLGVQFDNSQGGNTIYIDDVYIGAADLELHPPAEPGDPGPPLGDDFIFFVNGVNTMIPEFNGEVVDDPSDPTNKITLHQYVQDTWSFQKFQFAADVGVDMSQNRMDGDVLHARIWVDPVNAGKPRVQLLMEDKTDGSGANDGSADLPFRLVWRIPESMRDGQWHTISVPLPPPTYAELEDAKAAGELDGLDSLWKYAGAWSNGQFGVGVSDELGPNTSDNPDLWQEFEWTNVQNLGVHFDNNDGGGNIYLDDVYIGAVDLDLSDQTAPPPPAAGVSAVATADSNTVSWASVDGASAYRVYYSLEEITDIGVTGVGLVAQVGGDVTSTAHRFELPHSSLGPLTLNYAVTTLNDSGVENEDVSTSTASVANENLTVQPYIAELTMDEVDNLSDLLFDDSFENIVVDGFPEGYMPFELNMAHSKPGDGGRLSEDEDLSGKLWAGYNADPPELYLYVEVTDDEISLQASGGNPGDGWEHDSIEFGWGNYDLRDIPGGGIFTGSPPDRDLRERATTRGEFADYQFRIGGQGDGTKAGTEAYAFVGFSIDAIPQGGGAIYDQLTDENGGVVGYKILSLFPMDQIQSVDDMDAVVPLPTGDEIGYFPFNFVLNDGDGGNRDNQIQWSTKANADGQWWNTPAQWPAVALVGRTMETGVNVEVEELPGEIVLDQNYPNPFNPSTSIQFSLPASESVTLRVFDAMGRTVATLLDRKPHMAGKHTVQFNAEGLASGIYFYRLETGSSVLMTQRMVLIK